MNSEPLPSDVPSDQVSRRLTAVCDLMIPDVRENTGLHKYDGVVQDLSQTGVEAGLAALGSSTGHHHRHDRPDRGQRHDEAHLATFEAGLRWFFGDYQAHRRDPLLHLGGLDLACYDRAYAPEPERAAARAKHLAAWPDAIDVAVTTLDAVPGPVAAALLPAARGLVAALDDPTPGATAIAEEPVVEAARIAHTRLIAHLEGIAKTGDPECAVGSETLTKAMGAFEAIDQHRPLDLNHLANRADTERNRLAAMLAEACARLEPHLPTAEVVNGLLRDHPNIDGVITEAQAVTAEVLAFTREHRLAPWTDGECLVGPAPESRKWAVAMLSWAGPEEADAPSWYHITPPEPSWPAEEIAEWLSLFSRTTLPAITVHEVAPGHYAHSRSLRRLASPVRRQLIGGTFTEGWAHYAEEMVADEGFRGDDPRYVVGMCLEALVRVTRLACAIGLHVGTLSVADAVERFRADAYLGGAAARSEAHRGTFDITYGRYTFGKLALLDLRQRARAQWGADFSLPRLHEALLELGAPPIGLIDSIL
jgi:hypothetical protein